MLILFRMKYRNSRPYLSGLGIAWQRQAIVDGLWDKRVGKYRNSRRSRPRLIMSCCANSYASLVLACSAT